MATSYRRVSVLLPVPPYNQNSAFILEKDHVKKSIYKKPGINKQRLKKKKTALVPCLYCKKHACEGKTLST